MNKILLSIISIIILSVSYLNLQADDETKSLANSTVMTNTNNVALATFAGGCFWCMEPPFEKLNGVISAVSGYAGGSAANAEYRKVAAGQTNHLEVVQIKYNPELVSYETLLETFWRQIDPTDDGGSFVDRGKQYKSAIFYHNEKQKSIAVASKEALGKSGIFDDTIVTALYPLKEFFTAEGYHQDYYLENPVRYKLYRNGSGRDQFIKKNWKQHADLDLTPTDNTDTMNKSNVAKFWKEYTKPPTKELKQSLSPIQFKVTQKDGTERAFTGENWDNKDAGIYVDVLSGEPLFSSTHKYKSGTGWPSFWDVIEKDNVLEKEDNSLFMGKRIELRSKYADSHLGHVFPDGPQPTGMRYCINGASLRFIAKDDMQQEGYAEYLKLFN